MSKLVAMKRDNFTLKKAKILDNLVECEFEERKIVDGEPRVIQHTVKAPYVPHPDLISFKDDLKQYLMMTLCLTDQYDCDVKYLKGEQKKKSEEQHKAFCEKLVITGISISGDDQLKGVIITGKLKNRMGGFTALNSPRIIFSSDKLGFEGKVEDLSGLVEIEVYKCLFENKTSQQDLFDSNEELNVDAKAS